VLTPVLSFLSSGPLLWPLIWVVAQMICARNHSSPFTNGSR